MLSDMIISYLVGLEESHPQWCEWYKQDAWWPSGYGSGHGIERWVQTPKPVVPPPPLHHSSFP